MGVSFSLLLDANKGRKAMKGKLSAREMQALLFVIRGLTDVQIARQMGVSARTVRTYLSRAGDLVEGVAGAVVPFKSRSTITMMAHVLGILPVDCYWEQEYAKLKESSGAVDSESA